MSLSHAAHPLPRMTWWVVMLALVLTQALGLVHRVVHAPQSAHVASAALVATPPASTVAVAMAERTDFAGDANATPSWIDRLFASHDGGACDAYDQLAHADFLWGQPAQLCTQALSLSAPESHPAWQLAAQAAGYLARGPPMQA